MNTKAIIKIIKENHPEFSNSYFKVNSQGWSNLVFEVDEKFIFRVPRSEESRKDLEFEKEMLPKLSRISNLEIPSFKCVPSKDSDLEYVGYEMIPGVQLSNDSLTNCTEEETEMIASQIGYFLSKLHSIGDSKTIEKAHIFNKWEHLKATVLSKSVSVLNKAQIVWIEDLFINFEKLLMQSNIELSLIHGDFTEDHMLLNPVSNKIEGVIDFGDMQFNDTAFDFAGLYSSYGKSFMVKVLKYYDRNIDDFFMDRIEKFYIKQVLLHELLFAIENDEQERLHSVLQLISDSMR